MRRAAYELSEGGAVTGYPDLFNAWAPITQVAGRTGDRDIQEAENSEPLAKPVNGGTRSGREFSQMASKEALDVTAREPQRSETGWYRIERQGNTLRLVVGGFWTISEARRLDPLMRGFDPQGYGCVEIDCAGLERADTVGAWILFRTKRILEHKGITVQPVNVRAEYHALVHAIDHGCRAPPVEHPPPHTFVDRLDRIGRACFHLLHQAYALIGFFGLVTVKAVATLLRPRRLRLTALVHQMEETGLNALPIVGLLSFLIGVVVAYQGADQLRRFGAEVFTVNLLAVGVLRELGGMMAAIMVAARSGSAFTAQLGTMKVNQEIDALRISGLDPVEVLVLPRLLAVLVTLPLLTFYANLMGVIGGAAMCYFDLSITLPAFLHQMRGALHGWTFWLGFIKAPVFALIIGLVGCFQGLQVESNAASVGRLTTLAVVESIFLVIAADAMLSIVFSAFGV